MTETISNASEVTTQNQSVQPTQTAPEATPKAPKLYTDEEVNNIVAPKKQKAYEQGRQDGLAELQKQQQYSQNTAATQTPANHQPSQIGGMSQLSSEQIKQMVSSAIQEKENNIAATQFVNQFTQKMNTGNAKYTDFEKIVAPLDLPRIPDICALANLCDNTADIMYDLGKNPSKIGTLLALSKTAPHLAHLEIMKLSQSIKNNETASNIPGVKDPLSQVKPSSVGMDNGSVTVSDIRRNPKYRA
jgi:hypothetical protein